jgi:hypothetical protein
MNLLMVSLASFALSALFGFLGRADAANEDDMITRVLFCAFWWMTRRLTDVAFTIL